MTALCRYSATLNGRKLFTLAHAADKCHPGCARVNSLCALAAAQCLVMKRSEVSGDQIRCRTVEQSRVKNVNSARANRATHRIEIAAW